MGKNLVKGRKRKYRISVACPGIRKTHPESD
jgi:hypothetical protein